MRTLFSVEYGLYSIFPYIVFLEINERSMITIFFLKIQVTMATIGTDRHVIY